MSDPVIITFALLLVVVGSLDAYLTLRTPVARARAWHQHRCTRRWVRTLPACPVSASDAAGRAGTPVDSGRRGGDVPYPTPVVSAVPNSARQRVTL